MRAAAGRPPKDPVWVCPDRAAVDTALRALPSHGFTAGLFGQRDRALLVLTRIAGLPYKAIADLTAADLRTDPTTGTVTITAGGRTYLVEPVTDVVLCPTCALTRWLGTHAVMTRYLATAPLVDHLTRLTPVAVGSAHPCQRPAAVASGATGMGMGVALLPPINQWGHIPFPQTPLTPHATSQRTRDLLAGDLPAHRQITTPSPPPPIATPPTTTPRTAAPATAVELPAPPAWRGRRADHHHLAGLTDTLTDVERRAADLDTRVAQLLNAFSL